MRTLKEDYTGIEADGAALRLALSYAHLYRTEREQNLSGARVRRSSFLALAALLIIGPPLLWVLDVTLFGWGGGPFYTAARFSLINWPRHSRWRSPKSTGPFGR